MASREPVPMLPSLKHTRLLRSSKMVVIQEAGETQLSVKDTTLFIRLIKGRQLLLNENRRQKDVANFSSVVNSQ
jgi:hypothetical protein